MNGKEEWDTMIEMKKIINKYADNKYLSGELRMLGVMINDLMLEHPIETERFVMYHLFKVRRDGIREFDYDNTETRRCPIDMRKAELFEETWAGINRLNEEDEKKEKEENKEE